MYGSRAANRYAKALLEFAQESGNTDKVYEDMVSLSKTISENVDLQRLLSSPVVKSKVKLNVLMEIFTQITSETKRLFNLLIENRRLSLLELISEKYIIQYNNFIGKKVAVVTTAVPLTEDLKKQVLAKVEELTQNKKITIKNVVNPDIIGGFILRVEDLQYNASVAYKLNQYRQNFKKKLFVS